MTGGRFVQSSSKPYFFFPSQTLSMCGVKCETHAVSMRNIPCDVSDALLFPDYTFLLASPNPSVRWNSVTFYHNTIHNSTHSHFLASSAVGPPPGQQLNGHKDSWNQQVPDQESAADVRFQPLWVSFLVIPTMKTISSDNLMYSPSLGLSCSRICAKYWLHSTLLSVSRCDLCQDWFFTAWG